MKLHFLGGANEVGASSTWLEVAGKRILVDAGIRMQPKDNDPLPNLALIQENGGLDAILVTHAHTDHIGALPLVHLAYPAVPILTTAPTRALMQILMADALKIMEDRWEREQEIPLYPPHAVTSMLSRVVSVSPGEKIALADTLGVTFSPAGHVLGACSVQLDSSEGRVLFTGDYCINRQLTVEGMLLPRGRPHLVVTESTYGNRMHANRGAEECRLAAAVAEVVAKGGKALIPAFALGRAQEVILLLLQAQKKGEIPAFPIYVDGMVKGICSVYTGFPEFLARPLRRQVEKFGNPFFPQGGCAAPVLPCDRQKIVDGPPCALVSSSGMLTGGPSQFYARSLASDPKNAIFLTGYQDEESPGRRLLELAEGKANTLRLGGEEVAVACQVGKVSLSAHADSAQILGVLSRLSPQDVVIVHGDDEARAALAATVTTQVHLPANGEPLELNYQKGRRRTIVSFRPGIGQGEALDLEALRTHLLTLPVEGRMYTPQELAEFWHGSPISQDRVEEVRQALGKGKSGFVPDLRRPFLYRTTDPTPFKKSAKSKSIKSDQGRFEQNAALGEVDKLFAGCFDLYRKGVRCEQGELVLGFHFPAVAREQHKDKLEALAKETGWKVVLTINPHHGALMQAVNEVLPLDWQLVKTPAIYPGERVVIKVRCPSGFSLQLCQEVQTRFSQRTGHRLEVEANAAGAPLPAYQGGAQFGPMEQNQAFSFIAEAFRQRNVELYRISRKQDPTSGAFFLELSLVSPQVAQRYQDLLPILETATGWSLCFNPEPNQDVIKRLAKELLPPELGLKKEPGFFKTEGLVRVKTAQRPAPEEAVRLSEQFVEITGYRLELA